MKERVLQWSMVVRVAGYKSSDFLSRAVKNYFGEGL